MTAPELELTAAVEAAARTQYATALSLLSSGRDDEVYLAALDSWDEGRVKPTIKLYQRRIAMATLTGAVPAIARQAWDLGYDADRLYHANPWAEDLDDELRRL